MPANLLEKLGERLPAPFRKHQCDIFALVKAFVSDRKLAQRPLLRFPGSKPEILGPAILSLANGQSNCDLTVKWKQWAATWKQWAAKISHWIRGAPRSLGEDATLDYKRLAMYLEKNYRSKASVSWSQSFGLCCFSVDSGKLCREIRLLMHGAAPHLQRSRLVLTNPEPHVIHELKVSFHRHY